MFGDIVLPIILYLYLVWDVKCIESGLSRSRIQSRDQLRVSVSKEMVDQDKSVHKWQQCLSPWVAIFGFKKISYILLLLSICSAIYICLELYMMLYTLS